MFKENEQTGQYEPLIDFEKRCFTGPIYNSWGSHEQIISEADALKGVRERYAVAIKTLTYKGFEVGDIPMIWGDEDGSYSIYEQEHREEKARKEFGCDGDYTPEEMKKMFFDLCTDFKLTPEGVKLPEDQTVLCDDF